MCDEILVLRSIFSDYVATNRKVNSSIFGLINCRTANYRLYKISVNNQSDEMRASTNHTLSHREKEI